MYLSFLIISKPSPNNLESQILSQFSQKGNYIQIDNLIINPVPYPNTKWKPISIQLYHSIKHTIDYLPIFINAHTQETNQQIIIKQITKEKQYGVKILLCSLAQNHYIYGYFNLQQNKNIKQIILKFIDFYQYQVKTNTKITFFNCIRNHLFVQYDFSKCFGNDQLIMVHGLGRIDKIPQNKIQTSIQNENENTLTQHSNSTGEFKIQNQKNHDICLPSYSSRKRKNIITNMNLNLNRIQREQVITMADLQTLTLSERTLSTGASTPFQLPIQDQDWGLFRQYKNYNLFGENLIDEILHMKEYAKQAVYGQMIQVSFLKQLNSISLIGLKLSEIGNKIEQNLQKRMLYQKQISKDVKQNFKQYFQFYEQGSILSKDSKQITSTKTIQSERTFKQTKPRIHFTKGGQNY